MGIKFANSAYATLASSITDSATSITLTTGQGARFPSLSAGDFFYATLIDLSNNLEIVKCTARSTDVLTVVRAQEGTTARAYAASDRIELRVTAAGFSEMVQAGNANTFTAAQTFRAANAIRSEAAATQDAVVIAGRAGGSSSYAVTVVPATLAGNRTVTLPDANTNIPISSQTLTFSGPSAARTVTLPDENFSVGYRNVPLSGSAKTSSYTLATTDVGEYIEVASGGSITIPNSTFAAGDVISIVNNHTAAITITCSITDAYIAGTDVDKATMSLATRGVATVLFLSGTRCIVTGNVT